MARPARVSPARALSFSEVCMELRGPFPGVTEPQAGAPDLGFDCLVGRSAAHLAAVEHARMVAATPRTSVLLAGETGTG